MHYQALKATSTEIKFLC